MSIPRRQRGIATLLIVLLTGLAVAVASISGVYVLNSSRQRLLTTHAQTAAQGAAWRGVEIVRQFLQQVDLTAFAVDCVGDSYSGTSFDLMLDNHVALSALNLRQARLVRICKNGTTDYRITALITGEAGEERDGGSLATSTVEVVYHLSSIAGVTPKACQAKAAWVLNGDLIASGGGFSVTNNQEDLIDIAVNGVINLSGGQHVVSGCATKDITLTGGGVKSGGILYSHGKITMGSISPPQNVDLWGASIDIGNSGNFSFNNVRAGGFSVSIHAPDGTLLGTGVSGGIKRSDGRVDPINTVASDLTQNMIAVSTTDGDEFLLDLSSASIDSNGVINITDDSIGTISGGGEFSNSFYFEYADDFGGDISLWVPTVNTLWGNSLTIKNNGGTYSKTLAYGDLSVCRRSSLGLTQVGGDLRLSCDISSNNIPTVSTGSKLAGSISPSSVSISGLITGVSGFSPGLPGIPYCDVRVNSIDVESFKDQANYVFYYDIDSSGKKVPMLKIQNVKKKDGAVLSAGPYNLKNQPLKDILLCGWGNYGCGYNSPSNMSFGYSGKNWAWVEVKLNGWDFTGITKFPAGVLWFEGDVGFPNQTFSPMQNTILSTGNVYLGNSTVTLNAPNFASHQDVCGGDFYPANICDAWPKNADDSGLSLANMAVMTNKSLFASQWKVNGNIITGEKLETTGGALLEINGTVTTGVNVDSSLASTTISSGGLKITVPSDSGKLILPGSCNLSSSPIGSPQVSVLWSRYL